MSFSKGYDEMNEKQFQELKIGDIVTPHMISRGKGLLFRVVDKNFENEELTANLIKNQYGPFTKEQVKYLWMHKYKTEPNTDIRTGWLLWSRCKGTKDGRSTNGRIHCDMLHR